MFGIRDLGSGKNSSWIRTIRYRSGTPSTIMLTYVGFENISMFDSNRKVAEPEPQSDAEPEPQRDADPPLTAPVPKSY
jgi:hypothetical protein